jgi:predicted Zn-dependent protease
MEGTYIHEMLAVRDSAIARWPDRVTRPLRVHVRDSEELESWNPDFMPAVRDAFDTWVQAGIPVRFTFVRDSTTADIHVRFVSSFPTGISGKTVWSRDGFHWLLSSDIQLAVTHPNGGSITPPQMRAIALHEVGHLLGLDHTSDPDNIMSARIRVRELSEADRATVRLVYSVPAGSLK